MVGTMLGLFDDGVRLGLKVLGLDCGFVGR